MLQPRVRWVLFLLLLFTPACRRAPDPARSAAPPPAPAASPPEQSAPGGDGTGRPEIVALGDSLTAGLGLLESQAYPALLQRKLDQEGYHFQVVNAGVSGDTSAAGLQRTDWALQGDVRIVILELGANDGLRGLPTDQMQKNLTAIIDRVRQRNAAVLLLGMEAPPNFGPEYAGAFRRVYRDLAAREKLTLVPFMLDRVAGISSLNQGDGIHPNVEGTQIVAETIWKALKPMVDAVSAS